MKTKIDKFLFENNYCLKKDTIIKIIAAFGIFKILIILPDLFYIFGEQGLIQNIVNERHTFWYQPVLTWFSSLSKIIGVSENATLLFVIGVYLFSLGCLLANYKRTLFAVISWFIHFTLLNSTFLFSYGADYFTSFMLFINMLLCATYLFDIKSKKSLNSYIIRFLQLHLCIVYFFAGLGKAIGTDWFDGNAIWYVINMYTTNSTIENTIGMTDYPVFFKILSLGTVILELFYFVLIFIPKTRKITLVLVILMHFSIGIFMEFYTFGLVMSLLNIIAFGHYFRWSSFANNKSENLVVKTNQMM